MIQFHDFGIDIQTYTDRGKENDFPDVNQCPSPLSIPPPLAPSRIFDALPKGSTGAYHEKHGS
ncbi:hypothetical protein LG52_3522 [Geobacillus kaustophilus]|uniref:Uncharacterized protein n=1 Tax=Geobacillus kaustophilus TaxID=1462 RepID=A0A0D8BYG6_GEOKU|nr:hypothetical protein LG52_3522 [Geobacillus kaustophilus]